MSNPSTSPSDTTKADSLALYSRSLYNYTLSLWPEQRRGTEHRIPKPIIPPSATAPTAPEAQEAKPEDGKTSDSSKQSAQETSSTKVE